MAKAILELEMPESCRECPLQAISTEKKIRYCTVIRYTTDYYGTKRRDDCPLKPVEDKEKHGKWVLHGNDDDLGMTYYCSVCGFGLDEDLFYSGYKDGKWIRNHVFKHCPNCGTKMDE